ncbi:MAG TPA: leucyl/phenylalanyl-tRNA--protein transferase [Candidatus Kapabacteria bacterium]|nr:leucyl/phenylalanyl-tRNA--protein transferase [Candidatus Kapabacteria bacterium]HOV91735.1 leucyl/phenylalanyl-tRNA--protein transferase [Candidatus Kapabacteria bacterium]
MSTFLTPEIVILAYKRGFFPMAESVDGEIYWHSPERRAIFPIYNIKIPRSIRKIQNQNIYNYKIDTNFEAVIQYCASRKETWISDEIIQIYTDLFYMGYAHSVETYQDDNLLGGLYGVAIGGAFFGESMFNLEPNTAKLAFYKLIEILQKNHFLLLDSQYLNPFTYSLGAFEVPKKIFLSSLYKAILENCEFKL